MKVTLQYPNGEERPLGMARVASEIGRLLVSAKHWGHGIRLIVQEDDGASRKVRLASRPAKAAKPKSDAKKVKVRAKSGRKPKIDKAALWKAMNKPGFAIVKYAEKIGVHPMTMYRAAREVRGEKKAKA